MKKLWLVVIVGIFLVGVVSAVTCSSPSLTIMKLSSPTNAHGALWNDTSYMADICYSGIASASPHPVTCASPVLWLSANSNAHASTTQSATYNVPVCYENLVCNAVVDPITCAAGEVIVVRLYQTTNSHISDASDTNYPIKICCKSETQVRWEDMDGVPIMTSNIGNLVRMVKTSASSGDFEIREDDGESGDDDLYTIADGNAITGVSENGNLVGTWRITQDDFDKADEGIELDDGHIEAYFTIGSDVSGNLNISDEYIDDPMNITLESLKCGENFTQGMTTWINITASDPGSLITGNVTINGINIMNFSNGFNAVPYTWSRAGNLQVEVFAVNSRGFSMRKIISVMITDGSTADYVAACIDKPADFSDITFSNVRFDASSSIGLRCTLGVCQKVGVTGLWFTWKFSDNTFNFNHDGGLTELAYKFYKNYITAGHNWAELDVRMK